MYSLPLKLCDITCRTEDGLQSSYSTSRFTATRYTVHSGTAYSHKHAALMTAKNIIQPLLLIASFNDYQWLLPTTFLQRKTLLTGVVLFGSPTNRFDLMGPFNCTRRSNKTRMLPFPSLWSAATFLSFTLYSHQTYNT